MILVVGAVIPAWIAKLTLPGPASCHRVEVCIRYLLCLCHLVDVSPFVPDNQPEGVDTTHGQWHRVYGVVRHLTVTKLQFQVQPAATQPEFAPPLIYECTLV